ncbi:hypothetical protein ASE61_19625 [Bosea sp. Root670]|nr:hypothetical protein ASE61_19625 [Bosea sp. Root670]
MNARSDLGNAIRSTERTLFGMHFAGTKRLAYVVHGLSIPLHHHLDQRVSQKFFKRRLGNLAHVHPDRDFEGNSEAADQSRLE